ncbi:MAG: hypothetical protein WAX38_00360 [Minisyncoccia bacterium]
MSIGSSYNPQLFLWVKKYKLSIFAILVIALICGLVWVYYVPRVKSLNYYYDQITAQEHVEDGVEITAQEWQELNACKSIQGELKNKRTQDCLKKFYVDYTLRNGVRKSFSHLALLEKRSTNFIEDCHYISHGIGHAQLRVNNGDAGKAFGTISENLYFKNVATCGNGFFHGVIEEYAKYETDKDALVALLKPICTTQGPKSEIDCFHGVGHAAFVQLEYAIPESLYVCDRITDEPMKQYSCYMGVFMEMGQDFPTRQMVRVENGIMDFTLCNTLDSKYQLACYAQHSVLFENFNATPKDYKKNMRFCKQVKNDKYRMACVKFFAGRAVRAVQYPDLRGVCIDSTSSSDERIMCAATFANRIARALDSSRTTLLYQQAVHDVCGQLSFYDAPRCIDLVLHRYEKMYFDAESDRGM